MNDSTPHDLPPALRAAFADRHWAVAWSYDDRPTVWRLTKAEEPTLFVKVGPHDKFPRMADEVERTRWARRYVVAPTVVGHGAGRGLEWFEMVQLPGLDATVHPWRSDPARLVPALARSLRLLHEALPVDACPFRRPAAVAIADVRRRVGAGLVVPARDFHDEFSHLSAETAASRLEHLQPSSEELVVNHGDFCLPNVLFDEDGSTTGYLDLGEMAVADRRSDIVVGAWSVTWNLGPGWEQLFYDSYGVVPDADAIEFYRLLYDVSS